MSRLDFATELQCAIWIFFGIWVGGRNGVAQRIPIEIPESWAAH